MNETTLPTRQVPDVIERTLRIAALPEKVFSYFATR